FVDFVHVADRTMLTPLQDRFRMGRADAGHLAKLERIGRVDVDLALFLRSVIGCDGELLLYFRELLRGHVADMGNAVEVVDAGERAVLRAVAHDLLGATRADALDPLEMNGAGGVQVELCCHGSTLCSVAAGASQRGLGDPEAAGQPRSQYGNSI